MEGPSRPVRPRQQTRRKGIRPPFDLKRLAEWLDYCVPVEIFIHIAENLQIDQILQLCLIFKDPSNFLFRLRSMERYRLLFPSAEHLACLIPVFRLYYEIVAITEFSPEETVRLPSSTTPGEILSIWWLSITPFAKCADYMQLQLSLQARITAMFYNENDSHLRALVRSHGERGEHWCTSWHSQKERIIHISRKAPKHKRFLLINETIPWFKPIHHMSARFMNGLMNEVQLSLLKKQEQPLWEARAAQLLRMAALMERHPTLLKESTNSLQHPCEGTQRLTAKAHTSAFLCFRYARGDYKTLCYIRQNSFKYDHFPLVPFDHLLGLFIKKVAAMKDTFPIHLRKLVEVGYKRRSDIVHLTRKAAQTFTNCCRRQPENASLGFYGDVATVIKGLAYVYINHNPVPGFSPSPVDSRVLRTKFTPWSAPPYQVSLSRRSHSPIPSGFPSPTCPNKKRKRDGDRDHIQEQSQPSLNPDPYPALLKTPVASTTTPSPIITSHSKPANTTATAETPSPHLVAPFAPFRPPHHPIFLSPPSPPLLAARAPQCTLSEFRATLFNVPTKTQPDPSTFPYANPEKHDHRCLRFYTKTVRNAYPEAEVEWIEAFGRVMERLLQEEGKEGQSGEKVGNSGVEVKSGRSGKGKQREMGEVVKEIVQGGLEKGNGVHGNQELEMEGTETEAVGTKGVEENKTEKEAKKPRWTF